MDASLYKDCILTLPFVTYVSDPALLEMGCARAMNLAAYTDSGLAEMAAAYAFGNSRAHAFVDGRR